MFIRLGPSAAQHSSGFIVKRTGRYVLHYEENQHTLEVDVEDGRTMQAEYFVTIYKDSIKTWLPPFENDVISSEEKQRIINNIRDAEAFMNVKTDVA